MTVSQNDILPTRLTCGGYSSRHTKSRHHVTRRYGVPLADTACGLHADTQQWRIKGGGIGRCPKRFSGAL